MNNMNLMYEFITTIANRNMMTLFIKNIFNYKYLEDYNYISRVILQNGSVIIDIYDNISVNRFNRYIFLFNKVRFIYKTEKVDNVYVTYININKINDCNSNLFRLAHLFKLNRKRMISYAKKFLNEDILSILFEIINKPI